MHKKWIALSIEVDRNDENRNCYQKINLKTKIRGVFKTLSVIYYSVF